MRRVIIGQITVSENVLWKQTYETASWYTDYVVQPGVYDVVAFFSSQEAVLPYYISYRAYGRVVASLFVNRVFQFSSNEKDRDVDQVREIYPVISLTEPGLVLNAQGQGFLDLHNHYRQRAGLATVG